MSHSSNATRWQLLALLSVLLLTGCGGRTQAEASVEAPGPSEAATSAASQPDASGPAAPPASAGGGSGSGAGTASDACELLSEADITELATWAPDVAEPGPQQGVFSNGCLWTLSGGTSSAIYGPATISLGIIEPGGRSYYDRYFAPFAADYQQEPLVGVGDVGLVDSFTSTVLAVEGDALIGVQWLDLAGEDQIEMATAIAERVLANLARD